VRADGREVARLTGVPRAASTTIRLSGARTKVRVSGTTLGGQVVHATRRYRRCVRPTPRATPPPTEVGGGEDG
jgi:hypothetical protein